MSYDFDATATNGANLVTTTIQRPTDTVNWFFVLTGGVFFTKDLVVTDTYSGNELKPLTQYRVLESNQEATLETGLETGAIIAIVDTSVAQVTVTRRVVGGDYQTIGTDIDSVITENDLNALNSTLWGSIISKPIQYPVEQHTTYVEDIYGLEHVNNILETISAAITNGDQNGFNMFMQYIDRQVAALKTQIDTQFTAIQGDLNSAVTDSQFKPGVVIAMYSNANPATVLKYGTWQKITDTFLYGVSNDANLGVTKKVGEGPDYSVFGVYFWRLVSL